MLINSPNISGSLTVTGNSVITGSLTVLGGITGAITGSATTASYVEYANVANKPTLVSGSSQITYSGLTGIPSGIVSGSSQVSFNGIVDKPTLVSGSSQITYSGLTGIPSGIVSGSAQVAAFGYATTGSNGFNGSQSITGSLTVTGQVVAQTLNVQQVTSSIVYSSGSNIFGNSLANTQQFTGSVSVTGSLTVAGAGTFSNTLTLNGSNNVIRSGNELRFNRTDNLIYTRLYDAGSTFALDNTNGNGFSFQSAGTPQMVITSGGNLGLGVTPSAWSLGGSPVFQIGSGGVHLFGAGTQAQLGSNTFFNGSAYIYTTNYGATRYVQNAISGQHQWEIAPSGTAGNAISFTQAMTLDASGRLLLGFTTNQDGARLQVSGTGFVSGNLTIGQATAGTNVKLIFNGVASKAAGIEFHQSGTPQWYIGNGIASEDNNFELYNSNGTMAMKIIKSTNAINFTGAATFSSSVTATGGTEIPNGQFYRARRTSSNLLTDMIGIPSGTNDVRILTTGAFNVVSGGLTTFLGITDVGAATFSSTVTATGAVRSINGGVDGTYQDAFVGVFSSNNNEQNAIQTSVSSIAESSGFRFQVSNGGGSSGRTSMFNITRSGVKFQNGSSHLNYYEEGSWTPALQNATVSYSERSGSYVRIGNYVFVRWGFRISSISGQSGTVQISGLPFTAVSWGSYQEPNVSVSTGVLSTADYAQRARVYIAGGSTSLFGRIANNGDTAWNTSELQAGSWVIGEIFYNV